MTDLLLGVRAACCMLFCVSLFCVRGHLSFQQRSVSTFKCVHVTHCVAVSPRICVLCYLLVACVVTKQVIAWL